MIKFACWLENWSRRIKRKYCERAHNRFLKKYGVEDSCLTKLSNPHYNPYMATNVLLIEKLVKSREISKNDLILDVGCGTGVFLIYMMSEGFSNLIGYEIDENLYKLCISNVQKNREKHKITNITIINRDFFDESVNDDVTCFYNFNSFADIETYKKWTNVIKESLERNPRKIKIVIANPTIFSLTALDQCDWLFRKRKILDERQVCYHCNKIVVYESV